MKSKEKATNSYYKETRARWAREQTELLLNTIEDVGSRTGVSITPAQYVKAYKICVEELKFGYPAEFKVAEIISTDETYEQTLAIISEVMKWFRIEFHKTMKKRRNVKNTAKRAA